jgi:ketosteroid isomerase-like protein
MSQEDVALARSAYEAWNTGDMEIMLAAFHPDFEFVTSGTFIGLDAVYSGHDGFRRFWRDFSDTWDSISVSVGELRDYGDRVLGLITFEALGRDGVTVRRQEGAVFGFRDALIVRVETYGDWTGALKAVELSE